VVVELVVSAHITRDRLRSRGRPDDTDDAISHRIEEFERQTIPVLYWYRSRAELWSVDGDRADDDVTRELADRMEAWVSRRRDS
jgi:adenylate kinase family enzyme